MPDERAVSEDSKVRHGCASQRRAPVIIVPGRPSSSRVPESNRRHRLYKRRALPTELTRRGAIVSSGRSRSATIERALRISKQAKAAATEALRLSTRGSMRDRCHHVAPLCDETAKALAFSADHDRHRLGEQFETEEAVLGVGVETQGPHTKPAESFQAVGHRVDPGHREPLQGTGRRLHGRRAGWGRPPQRDDQAVDPSRQRRTGGGAQVVGILDVVENQ